MMMGWGKRFQFCNAAEGKAQKSTTKNYVKNEKQNVA